MDTALRLIMKRTGLFMLLLVSLALVPILFQNCSAPLNEENDVSSLATSAPFAFEHKLDHVAYMSCSNMPAGYDHNTYFTFKVGAYKVDSAKNAISGVKLNNAFVYHARNVVTSEKASVLAQSDANKNVYLSLGVRLSTNLQSGYRSDSNFVGTLTQSGVASVLAAKNGASFASHFPALAIDNHLEETAHYTGAEATYAQPMRDAINAGAYIATTYNRAGADTLAVLSPDNSTTHAYGLGFTANFNTLGFGLTSSYTAGPLRIMTNVKEYNLTTGTQTGATWDCKEEWRFMIIRPSDDVNTLCPGYSIEPTIDASSPLFEMYVTLRQLLPPTAWGVNLAKRCIVPLVPTQGQCYGTSTVPINYSGGVCDPVAGTCPHYVSICKRR